MRKYILLIGLLVAASFSTAQNLKVCTDKKGRCGYANEDGEIVVKCKYELAFAFENGLGKVGKNGKYGFVTPEGKEALPISYDEITLWSEGIYRIKSGDNYGLFSKEDGIIVKPKYSCISKVNSYGKALITVGGKNQEGRIVNTKVGIIEADGNIAIEPKYDKVNEFKPFESFVKSDIALNIRPNQMMHIGKMSKAEKAVMDARIKGAQQGGATNVVAPKIGIHPNDTLATAAEYVCCYKGKKAAVVNKRGTEITPFMANCYFQVPTNDMCAFRIGTTKVTTGYWDINNKKKLIIGKNLKLKKQTINITPFTGDVALVINSNTKEATSSIYFINKKGEKVSDNYAIASYKGGYWVTTKQAGNGVVWSALDNNGKTVFEAGKYLNIVPHNNGDRFTLINSTGKYGVIDKAGNIVIPFEYSNLGEPVNGWYWATREGTKTGIIDEQGEVVVPFEFHNLFMNTDKECTNIWVRKEANGYWCNYDIAKKKIVGPKVASSSNFSGEYAWVAPKGQIIPFTSGINRALCNRHKIDYTKANTMFGVLIDKEGNTKTTEPIPLGLFPAMKKALEANGGTLKPVQEREIIFKDIRNTLVIGLSQTVSEEYWDF